MDNNPQSIFVYSSLRSGFQHPAYGYISKYFVLEGDAVARGRLYDLGGNIVGIPTEENAFVKGELYTIRQAEEFSWALAQLDDYEGVNNNEGEAPLYKRVLTRVYINNRETTAWAYWYNRVVNQGHLIESGDILAYLQERNK